jgi:hypothetical protein
MMTTLLVLSVILGGMNNNNISISMMAYGEKGNNNNHSLINDISDQLHNSNIGADKDEIRRVLDTIQTVFVFAAGDDKATTAIDQIKLIIQSNPNGPLAQSLLLLAKEQALGNTNVVTQAALKMAAQISSSKDLGQSLDQAIMQQFSETQFTNSPSQLSSSHLPTLMARSPQPFSGQQTRILSTDGTDSTTTSTTRSDSDKSTMEGIGEEPDTDENEANAQSRGEEARSLTSNIVVPDDTPFKSTKCDGSLDKFVPNPFIQAINSQRFLVGDCITVVGNVIWTHYINVDGDANFNVKLDDKYNSLLTPANNSPKFNGAIHVEVVCQGPNKSVDPIKVNQCKSPKYDGPKFRLPPVGTRVQVTGRYLLDVNEGGHAEIHPAYEIIFNPVSSPSPPPSPAPPPSPPPSQTPAPPPSTDNNAPIADAGHSRPDQIVSEGSLVMLDGSASHDPDGDPLSFVWTQISGPPVQLSNPNEAKTSFSAPSNLSNDTRLVFKLTVTDTAGLSDRDMVFVLVRHTSTIGTSSSSS